MIYYIFLFLFILVSCNNPDKNTQNSSIDKRNILSKCGAVNSTIKEEDSLLFLDDDVVYLYRSNEIVRKLYLYDNKCVKHEIEKKDSD